MARLDQIPPEGPRIGKPVTFNGVGDSGAGPWLRFRCNRADRLMQEQVARSALSYIARPQSVAVIGASPDLSRYPGKVINNLKRFDYAGRVYAVTPRYTEVLGYRAFPDMKSVPEPVDVALILLGAANAPAALQQAAEAGCRSAIIYSAGMAEVGETGRRLQTEMLRVAADAHIRILGPNCLGSVNVVDRTVLCGAAALFRDDLIPGKIGVAAPERRHHGLDHRPCLVPRHRAQLRVLDRQRSRYRPQ